METNKTMKSITLRRDGKGPLKFKGERIGDASRTQVINDENDHEDRIFEVSARLYQTAASKYALGYEVYNRTDECYDTRNAWAADSLVNLAAMLVPHVRGWLDDDILAEVFQGTAVEDLYAESID
jgi:hypothetical protein